MRALLGRVHVARRGAREQRGAARGADARRGPSSTAGRRVGGAAERGEPAAARRRRRSRARAPARGRRGPSRARRAARRARPRRARSPARARAAPGRPTTDTSVSEATAADSCSVPEFAASDADSSSVLRRIGSSARVVTLRQANRVSTPPAAGLRPIDPGPFRAAPRADRRARRLRARRGAPRPPASTRSGAADVAAGGAARGGLLGGFQWDREDSDTEGLVSAGDRRARRPSCSCPGTPSATAPRGCRWSTSPPAATATSRSSPRTASRSRPTPAGSPGARTCSTSPTRTRGLRVFDLTRFAGATLPQAGWYRPAEKGLRFSYASVDAAAGVAAGRRVHGQGARAPGSCAGRSRPAGCSRRSRRATRG